MMCLHSDVVGWLEANELPELEEVFQRHKITTMKRMRSLTTELIKELIPELGLRAEFEASIRSLTPDTSSSESIANSDTDENCSVINVAKTNNIVDESGNVVTVLQIGDFQTSEEKLESPRKRPKFNSYPKHILSYQAVQALRSFDLRAALEDDILSSNAVLTASRTGGLSESDRTIIVAICAKVLLRHNSSPSKEEYLTIAEKICDIFTFEDLGTYFVPGLHGKNASGKLPNKVRNLKYSLSKSGDSSLKNFCDAIRVPRTQTPVTGPADLGFCDPEDEKVQEALTSLKFEDSWPEILRHWSTIHPLRRNGDPVDEEVFQVLKAPNGHLLICQDFKELFPDREHCLLSLWENSRAPIISLLERELSKKDSTSLQLLESVKTLHPSKQDALIFYLLPVLCSKKGRGNSATNAPPLALVRKSFLLHVKVPGDITREVQAHQANLKKRGLKFQPLILAVGPSLEEISAWYVQVESARYHIRTAVSALDICFKSFFSLNLKYPADCSALWLFIQKFFLISTSLMI